ncbi:MAG TPA: NapC/NirT family cytochrome c [Terriglobales bacterium]|nr:NapC/NirT family cytochrome c [Terriglobales bacterium]
MSEERGGGSLPAAGASKIRKLLRNPLSLIGLALALVALANIFFLFFIDLTSDRPSPYVGILAYMVAPGFLIFGLLLIPIGVWNDRRRRSGHRPEQASRYLRIDFADPGQRGAVAFFLCFVVVFVMMSAVGSYRAYEFTDSVQFCGQLCHSVMAPEFTAYQQSPHARVACVDCHVGAGATWYVRSKLSGARQVIATTFNTFPRPIPTPVHNLRPAQETCEQCHWPRKFYGAQLKVFTHYSSDEKNTVRQIRMLIKTGGGDPATGAPSGIHWHMNIGNEINYVSTDDKHQVIPYIHVKDMQGRVTEYFAQDATIPKEQLQKAARRRMDCVDCHNRPTHIYVPPDQAVDHSLLARRMDLSLPFLKATAVSALTGTYKTSDEAMQGIATEVHKFYSSKYPALEKVKQSEIRDAISEIQRIYRSTMFPEMKLDWKTHTNNIGHLYFPGCFRCHDGQHVSAEGKVLKKDCDTCHTVLSEQEGDAAAVVSEGMPFKHPVDLGDLTAVNCNDCHTGGTGP